MTKDELAAIQRGEPVITEQEQLADREPTEYADLNMADDFDRAVWQIREDYADAAEIESELRLAKLWAERVEVDYDEGPSAIGFHKDGSTYWYLIGDACWDADDPRSEMLAYVCKHWKCTSDERDAVEATLATVRSDAHLAREAMAAVQEDLRKAEKRIAEVTKERDEARAQRDRADRSGTWRTLHGSTIEEIAAERDQLKRELGLRQESDRPDIFKRALAQRDHYRKECEELDAQLVRLQPLRTLLRSWDWKTIAEDGVLPRDTPVESQVIAAFATVEREENALASKNGDGE